MIRGLESRYVFKGNLVLQTAMHIGGGDATLGTTDSPVIRTAEGKPFIPGSSLKGAFRSTVEKLAATIGLPNTEIDVIDTSSEWHKKFHKRLTDQRWSEEQTIQNVAAEWPATAMLFGNPYTASKIFFADAMLSDDEITTVQRRDGVAIDRDSERAMDRLKYDYEVVPSSLRFGFELHLENPTSEELALTCLGLSEMVSGFFGLGGKRSSGLGRCMLEDFEVYALDLRDDKATRAENLKQYLTGESLEKKMNRKTGKDATQFINDSITVLFKEVSQC